MTKNIFKKVKIVLYILLAGFLFACEHEIPVNAPLQGIQPTFSSIQANILSRKCAIPGCHTGSSPEGGLNMTASQAYGNLVNVNSNYGPPRIAPNDPNNSVLYQKVLGNSRFGERMPQGSQVGLSSEDLKAILDWINDGAPNN